MITANHAVPTVNSPMKRPHHVEQAPPCPDRGPGERGAGLAHAVGDGSASVGVAVSSLDTCTQMRAGVTDLLLIGPDFVFVSGAQGASV